jgi:predicted unusual protein kinase regulating ubiquinone biosynthesis (AarF/ABC1/UbiB family)
MQITTQQVPSSGRLYKELAVLLAKHGGRVVAEKVHLVPSAPDEAQRGEELAQDLEGLGPTFVKLGQLLSTRADILTPDTLEALERLQDDVEALPVEAIAAVIEEEFGSPPERLFRSFEPIPLASASLGQVHRAVLHSGEEVIVKVQRPMVAERVETELKVLAEVSTTLEKYSEQARRYRLIELVEELRHSLTRELDYRLEMENLLVFQRLLTGNECVVVPGVHQRYTTRRVITMDFVRGDKLPKESLVGHSQGPRLADELFRVYLRHVLIDGMFHADPHPGNLLITAEGQLCMLDLGMVGTMPKSLQVTLAQLLIAVTDKDGEQAAETALDASGRDENCNLSRFRRQICELVSDYHRRPITQVQAGALILEIAQAASDNGILLPYELTMLAKTMMSLDEIGRRLDPEFNPTAAMERHLPQIMRERLQKDIDPKALLNAYLEARTLLKDGPRMANNILRDLERGTFKFRVDAIDESELLVSFQKIANRIGMCLVIASLILGASLLMGADVRGPSLFGFPAFAVISFLLAASGGVWMVWSIQKQDRHSKKELNQPLRPAGQP